MKSINKIFLSLFSLSLLIVHPTNTYAAGEETLDKVMKIMIVLTLVIIAIVIWLAVVYSEKNDSEGKFFLDPIRVFNKFITRTTPVEKEQEILLKHDYDGIRELDNRIPPWFHFLFYGTIIWAVIYMLVFHVFDDGQIQSKEYQAEIQQASLERQILIKTGAFLNEETVTFTDDTAVLNEGKDIYIRNCAACHGQNGEGLVGPNLTDDYWIHGGGIKNIFKVTKYGVPAKGMIAWEAQLDPNQIRAVSSYIITLHDTNPHNSKAPEGDKWVEDKDI